MSVISIVGFVVLGLCILLGIWKGMIRMLLNVLVIGLAIAAASLGVNPIREALAEQDYFGQEWLETVLSGNFAFVIVFFVVLVLGLIVKAIIMHFVDKDGGKIKGAFQAVNRILGGVIGAGIGFLAFGFILMCYTSIVAVLNYEGDMDAAIASLDSISAWMMNNNVFQKIVEPSKARQKVRRQCCVEANDITCRGECDLHSP